MLISDAKEHGERGINASPALYAEVRSLTLRRQVDGRTINVTGGVKRRSNACEMGNDVVSHGENMRASPE